MPPRTTTRLPCTVRIGRNPTSIGEHCMRHGANSRTRHRLTAERSRLARQRDSPYGAIFRSQSFPFPKHLMQRRARPTCTHSTRNLPTHRQSAIRFGRPAAIGSSLLIMGWMTDRFWRNRRGSCERDARLSLGPPRIVARLAPTNQHRVTLPARSFHWRIDGRPPCASACTGRLPDLSVPCGHAPGRRSPPRNRSLG